MKRETKIIFDSCLKCPFLEEKEDNSFFCQKTKDETFSAEELKQWIVSNKCPLPMSGFRYC